MLTFILNVFQRIKYYKINAKYCISDTMTRCEEEFKYKSKCQTVSCLTF